MVLDASPLRRRRFGVALATALALPASGCLGDDDDDGDDETDDEPVFETTVLWVTALDEDGEAVPDAEVRILDETGTVAEKETGSDGAAFFDIEAGEYGITVETEAGSAEETVELEEGDDGEVDVEVPVPDEDE